MDQVGAVCVFGQKNSSSQKIISQSVFVHDLDLYDLVGVGNDEFLIPDGIQCFVDDLRLKFLLVSVNCDHTERVACALNYISTKLGPHLIFFEGQTNNKISQEKWLHDSKPPLEYAFAIAPYSLVFLISYHTLC